MPCSTRDQSLPYWDKTAAGAKTGPTLFYRWRLRRRRQGSAWGAPLDMQPLPSGFYDWLAEKFLRRTPSSELLAISDAPFCAVYTSSIDPGVLNLFATSGREPALVLTGDPPPPVLRSRRRVPIYHLFGRAGVGVREFEPPNSSQGLATRRLRHASAMLRTVNEAATPLGLIIVDAYTPGRDWLRAEDLLAIPPPIDRNGDEGLPRPLRLRHNQSMIWATSLRDENLLLKSGNEALGRAFIEYSVSSIKLEDSL